MLELNHYEVALVVAALLLAFILLLMPKKNNPHIFYHPGGYIHDRIEPPGWYFWHEDECTHSGPYRTEMACVSACRHYCEMI